ncbi:hypothetical protein EIN_453180 [Entamoeba invadens IP1]|uniref:Uncharacterized protein n=1 Tax=Entamoeba invadens IP1 TaxID=370355 RepID=L7FMU4_ENTIV|nr:hypothetical protein EIN_453180 [Entamoeba invadens IP1]ELP89688.1 hypothetical protein EIN_453180 [Entamoeba invadens IP1]|eukprot:XP_004256459.1 hypothetical protein EIN_453180 [Entamoeba invadens IP1]
MEETFDVLSDVFSHLDETNELSLSDLLRVQKEVSRISEPIDYTVFFDSIIFSSLSQKEAFLTQKSDCCNCALFDDYYICKCDPRVTLYFCPACNSHLDPSTHTPLQDSITSLRCQGKMNHLKGTVPLYAICNCGNTCTDLKCTHINCTKDRNSCTEHKKYTDYMKRCSNKDIENGLEKLALVLLDYLDDRKEVEAVCLLKYLIDLFNSFQLAYNFEFILSSKRFVDEGCQKFYDFFNSGQNLVSKLCDFAANYNSLNQTITKLLITLLAQIKNKKSFDIESGESNFFYFAKAVHNKSFPVLQSDQLINTFTFCLFGNTVFMTHHKQNSLCLTAVFSLLVEKNTKLKLLNEQSKVGASDNPFENKDFVYKKTSQNVPQKESNKNTLKSNYASFFVSLTATKALFINRFSHDDYLEMFRCILESDSTQNALFFSVASFTGKLMFSSKKTPDLYTSMQMKLFEIPLICLNAIFINATHTDAKSLRKIVPPLLQRISAEFTNMETSATHAEICRTTTGDFRYAPLISRVLGFIERVCWAKTEMDLATLRSGKKRKIAKEDFTTEFVTSNNSKPLKNIEEFFVVQRLFLENLNYELPDFAVFGDEKLAIANVAFLLNSYDPGLGRRVDLFIKQIAFAKMKSDEWEKQRKEIVTYEHTLERVKNEKVKENKLGVIYGQKSNEKHRESVVKDEERIAKLLEESQRDEEESSNDLKEDEREDKEMKSELLCAKKNETRIDELTLRKAQRSLRREDRERRRRARNRVIWEILIRQRKQGLCWYYDALFVLEENNLEENFVNPDDKYITAYFLMYLDIRFVKYIIKNQYDVLRLHKVGRLEVNEPPTWLSQMPFVSPESNNTQKTQITSEIPSSSSEKGLSKDLRRKPLKSKTKKGKAETTFLPVANFGDTTAERVKESFKEVTKKEEKPLEYVSVDDDGNVCFLENGPQISVERCMWLYPVSFCKAMYFNPMVPDFLGERYRELWLDYFVLLCGQNNDSSLVVFSSPITKLNGLVPGNLFLFNSMDFARLENLLQMKSKQLEIQKETNELVFMEKQEEFGVIIRMCWISSFLGKLGKKLCEKEVMKKKTENDAKLKVLLIGVIAQLKKEVGLEDSKKEKEKFRSEIVERKKQAIELLHTVLTQVNTVLLEGDKRTNIINTKNKTKALLFLESAVTVLSSYSTSNGFYNKTKV